MSRNGETILVVEDDIDTRSTLVALLRKEGYDAQGAANGADAIHAIELGFLPLVILADMHMPGIVGGELAEYARHHEVLAGTAIAFITAAPDTVPPGYPVFPKPAAFADVLRFVRGHLEQRTAA